MHCNDDDDDYDDDDGDGAHDGDVDDDIQDIHKSHRWTQSWLGKNAHGTTIVIVGHRWI